MIAECYIGFSKLLNEELKAFDLKDSVFFDTLKVGSLSQRALSSLNAKTTLEIKEQQALLANNKAVSEINFARTVIGTKKQKKFTERLWICG